MVLCFDETKAHSAGTVRDLRHGEDGGARAARRRSHYEVRRVAGTEGWRRLHGRPRNPSISRARNDRGQDRSGATKLSPRGCARDLLSDGLLSKPSRRAGTSLAHRSDALRDLLSVSWRLTLPKARKRKRTGIVLTTSGATVHHIRCVCGNPCNRRSGGPLPHERTKMLVSPV